jgi:hypothetical protein
VIDMIDIGAIPIGAMLLASAIVDAALWGTTGYVFFRRLGGRDERWWIGLAVMLVVALVFDLTDVTFWAGLTDDSEMKGRVRTSYASSTALRVLPLTIGFKLAQRWLRGSFVCGTP